MTKCVVSRVIPSSRPHTATVAVCGVRFKFRSYLDELWRSEGNPWIICLRYSVSFLWEGEYCCAEQPRVRY